MRYSNAMREAETQSREQQCTVHVTARVRKAKTHPILARRAEDMEPTLDPLGYTVSDWLDGTVCATFTNGVRTDV